MYTRAQSGSPQQRYDAFPTNATLDESVSPSVRPAVLKAQNAVYRRFGAIGKRTGTSVAATAPDVKISDGLWFPGGNLFADILLVWANGNLYSGNPLGGYAFNLATIAGGFTAPGAGFFSTGYVPSYGNIAVITGATGSSAGYWNHSYNGTIAMPSSFAPNYSLYWHDHQWYWSPSSNVLWVSDIFNSTTFNYVSAFGGYNVGLGDNETGIYALAPNGNNLLVLKANHIYQAYGWDFFQGEAQFQIQPYIYGSGTTQSRSVANLNGNTIYWDGSNFQMLAPYAASPTAIGTPIINELALTALNQGGDIASGGNFPQMTAAAGSFLVKNPLYPSGYTIYSNLYLCAVNTGDRATDTILVYDDDASRQRGVPAWSVWTGLNIGSFIPIKAMPGTTGNPTVIPPLLLMADRVNANIYQLGGNGTNDNGNAIPFELMLGQFTWGKPDNIKELDRIFLDAYLYTGSPSFAISVSSDEGTESASVEPIVSETTFISEEAAVQPSVRGVNFTIDITESSTGSAYEIANLSAHFIEEAPRA